MRIGLIGSGWLAQPLARSLQSDKHTVWLTTRHKDKQKQLKQTGLPTAIFHLGSHLPVACSKVDVLIIATPNKDISAHHRLAQDLLKHSHLHPIFISSTSVYANDGQLHKEDSTHILTAKPLYQIESLFRQHLKTTVMRCGGLIGPNRHPGRFFAGKTITTPKAPVNLLPLEDAIGIIKKIINEGIENTTVNACSPEHPLKGDYYPKMTESIALEPPQIDTSSENPGKTVNVEYLTETLKYPFKSSIWD